jgi:hypothetical protein
MNHSIYSADRTTHLKIVAVALVAGISIMTFGIAARSTGDSNAYAQQTVRVIKADKPVMVTSSGASMIR